MQLGLDQTVAQLRRVLAEVEARDHDNRAETEAVEAALLSEEDAPTPHSSASIRWAPVLPLSPYFYLVLPTLTLLHLVLSSFTWFYQVFFWYSIFRCLVSLHWNLFYQV